GGLPLVQALPMRTHPELDATSRRADRRRLFTSLCGLVALGLAAERNAAAAEADGDIDRWVPSLSFYFDVTRQKADGSVTTGLLQGPPLPTGCSGSGGGLCPSTRLEYALVDHADAASDTSV